MNCTESAPLLALAPLDDAGDLLGPEASALALHVAGCADCGGRMTRWAAFCERWKSETPADLQPSASVRARLLASVAEDDATRAAGQKPASEPEPAPAASSGRSPHVRLVGPVRPGTTCSYCHGELAPRRGVLCASCLAPHHGACFREHGACATIGCGQTNTILPPLAPAAPPRWSRPRLALAAASLLLAAFSGAFGAWTHSDGIALQEERLIQESARVADLVAEFVDPRSIIDRHDNRTEAEHRRALDERWSQRFESIIADSGGTILAIAVVERSVMTPQTQTHLAMAPREGSLVIQQQEALHTEPGLTAYACQLEGKPALRLDRTMAPSRWFGVQHVLTTPPDQREVLVSVFLRADRFEADTQAFTWRVVLLSLCGMLSGLGLALLVLRKPKG